MSFTIDCVKHSQVRKYNFNNYIQSWMPSLSERFRQVGADGKHKPWWLTYSLQIQVNQHQMNTEQNNFYSTKNECNI